MPLDRRSGWALVEFTDDEAKALDWAARKGAADLRREGWKDMARNADILDSAREKFATLMEER